MRYTTKRTGPRPPDNYNHLEVFALVPHEGEMPPGASVLVKATFHPDHARMWPFLASYSVAGRDQELSIDTPPIVLRFPKDQKEQTGYPPDSLAVSVGCITLNDAKKSSSGSFEVEFVAEAKERSYFRVSPEKGTVAPGASVEVRFIFEPPAPPAGMPGPAAFKGSTREVGQWCKVLALVHLRGGHRPAGSSDVQRIPVQLEGFVVVA